MKKEKKFLFGDKVHDWLDHDKNYIILKKTRGKYYYIVDENLTGYSIFAGRLHEGWKKKRRAK